MLVLLFPQRQKKVAMIQLRTFILIRFLLLHVDNISRTYLNASISNFNKGKVNKKEVTFSDFYI